MIEAYPLYWPEEKKRTAPHKVQKSRFQTTFGAAVNSLNDELRRLGAKSVVISTDVPLRRDGLPRASSKAPEDTGAAVYFEYNGKQMCFACDRWNRVGDNIHAVAKTIEAMRGIERWGTGDMLSSVFAGFEALPEHVESWRAVLGDAENAAQIEAAYKALAKTRHPDVGGSNEDMAKLNRAREIALEELT